MHYYQDTTPSSGAESVVWDLTDLYPSQTSPEFISDLQNVQQDAVVFQQRWKGKIQFLSDDEMLMMIQELEHISDVMGKLSAFVRLQWATDNLDFETAKAMQSTNEALLVPRQQLIFVGVELRTMPEDRFTFYVDSPLLKHYKHWLESSRAYAPHTLSETEEQITSEMSITGRSAWVRFFDEHTASLRFDFEGREVLQQELFMYTQQEDREKRKLATEALAKGLEKASRATTFIFNNIVNDCAISDKRRNYPTWVTSRNMANKISDEAVEKLVESVVARYSLVGRFFDLKKNLLGLDTLHDYDRNAPIGGAAKKYTWQEAKEIVTKAYNEFDTEIGAIVEMFFEKNWIHAQVKPGKQSGAFASPTVPTAHPYIMMNFNGTARDVKTLAHELGHGVHQYLSRKQGYMNFYTPLTIAETASVFGEMLTFDSMMQQASSDEEKLTLLMDKLNDINNTVFRQISLNRFENALHETRKQEGELSTDKINELWMQTQVPSFAGSVTLSEGYKWYWSYISHFIHAPGYVYAYAFGELLVLALFELYKESDESFKQKYSDLLSAGGKDTPENLLLPFGINLNDPTFWQRGLQFIERLLDQAEDIAKRIK